MADVTRRGFLRGLGLLAGGIALEQAIPLGRVWSFPSEIKIYPAGTWGAFKRSDFAYVNVCGGELSFRGIPYLQTTTDSGTWLGLDRHEVLGG